VRFNLLLSRGSKIILELPTPSNLSIFWNFGFMLGSALFFQIITGLLLALTYSVRDSVFSSIFFMLEIYDFGWVYRFCHANGASLFFVFIYIHIGRGLYYNSYFNAPTWLTGSTILLLLIAAAFLGYVLPINQISFWGASVITNLFREIPIFGPSVVTTMWGGPLVSVVTVTRFFCLHFITPFIILFIVFLHVIFLHSFGSRNPVGFRSRLDKVVFFIYSSKKDLLIYFCTLGLFFFLVFFKPLILGDNENFTESNSVVTPHHIQPEWYFLFSYAILRSVPSKLGGVIALVRSILVLFLMPFIYRNLYVRVIFSFIKQFFFWLFINLWLLLTWVGSCPVEAPFLGLGQLFSFLYFFYFLI